VLLVATVAVVSIAAVSVYHGGIDAVIKDMRQHPEDAKVQEKGCKAMANFARNADNAVKIEAGGGVEAIVQAMGGHRGSDGLQRAGAALALWSFAAHNTDNKVKIDAGGGVEAIVQAMGGHRGSDGVQVGCGALWTL
jgi:hypothetical protein